MIVVNFVVFEYFFGFKDIFIWFKYGWFVIFKGVDFVYIYYFWFVSFVEVIFIYYYLF